MPALTRRFLATAAAMLLLGVAVGFLMLVRRDLGVAGPTRGMISAHTHLLLVGGVIELIIGTAWWLFPRPARALPAAAILAVEAAWWLLTGGTLVRGVGEIGGWPLASLAGGAAQLLGLIAAILGLRHRVVPSRRPDARR